MTFKQEIRSNLEMLINLHGKYSQKAESIYQSEVLTTAGKESEVKRLQDDLGAYLNKVGDSVKKRASEIMQRIDEEERRSLQEKVGNADYAALLANTIAILPMVIKNADHEELRERLSIFTNDPIAIAAISNKFDEVCGGFDRMNFYDIIPKDMRGTRQQTLRELINTFRDEINRVYNSLRFRGERYDLSLPASIQSTINYVECCNDDCTEYTQTEVNSAQIGEVFNLGLTSVRDGNNNSPVRGL